MPTSPEIINRTGNKEYSVTRLRKDNLGDLAILYSEVYKIVRSGDYFIKKYNTAYTGLENVGFIAYSKEGKPIAYYGVIPCFILFENELILAAQSADTMTHPEHRCKGMFTELSNITFDLCQQLNIKLIFGFPNQNSYPAMINRLGWIETEKISRFTIPVNTIPGRFFFQNRKKYQERILSKLLLPQKGLLNSVIADGYAGIYRDNAYYQYKTFEKTYVIKTRSADVWIKINKELVIGDITLTANRGKDFFDEIKTLAKELNLNKISFQVCSDCHLHDLFASCYKTIPSFPVLFKDFGSGLTLKKIKFTFGDIDIF